MLGFFTSLTVAALLFSCQKKPVDARTLTRQQLKLRQANSDPNALPTGWSPVACFTDTAQGRTLLGPSLTSSNMTPAVCINFCTPGGFGFAGVEFGSECFCDYVVQDSAEQVDTSQCTDPCSGDGALTCGSANRISIFQSSLPDVIHPENPAFVGPWQYKGCFSEQIRGARILERMVGISGPVSVETCTAVCKSMNFALAGLENGGESWCGHSKRAGIQVPSTQCGSACSGNASEFCGTTVQNGGPTETTRQTLYQDTSAQFDLQTCLTSTIFFNFNLHAFSQSDPEISLPLVLVPETNISTGFFVLSACNNCSGAIPSPDDLGEFPGALFAGAFSSSVVQASFTVNPGESPAFQNIEPFSVVPNFTGYCGMANLAFSTDPLFPPLLLGANSRADLWAICPNITAEGRLDVVFSPVANHAHYVASDCEAVFLRMDLTSD